MKSIIVVSYGDDVHKSVFEATAKKRGIETILFDAGGYPASNDKIAFDYQNGNPRIWFDISGRIIRPEEILGIWWRRPRGGNQKVKNAMGQYVKLEGESVIRSLADFLPSINWVSEPEATRMACRKPVQLAIAQRVGLKIPDTCISNSESEVIKFIDRLGNKKMIIKPVGTSFIDMSTETGQANKVIFTKVIDPKLILKNIGMIKKCPVIFQESVQKDSDVRITVIDQEVFCAEITLEGCPDQQNVDWRNHKGVRVYKKHNLPKHIAELCVHFTANMGLRFGCIDMAFSVKNGYTFFEINPQGQWLPSEMQLGYPISEVLLNALIRRS